MRIFAALFLATLVACESQQKWNVEDYQDAEMVKHLPFQVNGVETGTWNVGLFPWEDPTPYIAAVPRYYAVLALQEVWSEEIANAFVKGLRHTYPFHYYASGTTTYDIGCAPTLPWQVCYAVLGINMTNCVPYIASTLLSCLVSQGYQLNRVTNDEIFASSCASYAAALLFMDNMCPVCLTNAAYSSGGTANEIFNTCMNQAGPRYTFGGTTGQLILSKVPIHNPRQVDFQSYGARRANVHADIAGLHYAFGHFSYDILADAGLTGQIPPLPGALQPEMAAEMINSGADVIVGDLNSGVNYQPTAYNELLTDYIDLGAGTNTYCTQPMIDAQDPRCVVQSGGTSFARLPLAIDHVLVHNKWSPFLDGSSLFASTPETAAIPLSDHAGLEAHCLLFHWSLSKEALLLDQ